MRSLGPLLALTCLGSGGVLLLGRHLLLQRPGLTPATPVAALERERRFSPDPVRRRDAALLLVANEDAARQRSPDQAWISRLLRNQAWGQDPLAAVVLKRSAQAASRQGDGVGSERLWSQLLRRFPKSPATADALYALGRKQPGLRQRLLTQFPAHPAALAAAVEAGPAGAGHLARWGARWPGAREVITKACGAPPSDPVRRDELAQALARLGDPAGARTCLGDTAGSPATQLELARTLIRQSDSREQAEAQLLELARRQPDSPEALEAVRLLADGTSPSSLERLSSLPPALQETAPVQARRALVLGQTSSTLAVLQRWPKDPASWDLQWQQARERLLREDWRGAAVLLGTSALDPDAMAAPLDARRRFWLALSQWELGERPQAKAGWADLLARYPGGYYGWRAAQRLGRGDLVLDPATAPPLRDGTWRPLMSGLDDLDGLWRLGQNLEAWEQWRHLRGEDAITSPQHLVLEGRLRRGVGDQWTGLGQLEQASLRAPSSDCALQMELALSQAEPAFVDVLNQAGQQERVPAALLAAVAKQESRFSPAVRSPVGAVGLLQLMPETAAELAGGPTTPDSLENPELNATLGGRYLRQLMDRWQGNPFLVAASYNAGPQAAAGWSNPRLKTLPEWWVEAIPYPETRLYVKKVLGNLWTYQNTDLPLCS
ncbi:lytic transglycosylase domain-containing protein [Cyanobium sp. NIES-981]|uniref:lytic transglycosylase domain-containing protein n=1 Tax=Cyanobium sp. NIES-981 TaxID=1851505 RepID=UPI0007DDC199|nr:lytic transglycosylase domain-containing protein [Cyanobium sp. NIES-981]SBO43655.1 putative soluble lytic transglycosylase [Cyanobium sp. NIES-981]